MPHLFERFSRIEGARRRSHEGSGIGLALVHELVEMHGGTIAVESKIERRHEFKVRLPFGHEHLASGHIATRSEQPARSSGHRPSPTSRKRSAGCPGHDQFKNEIARFVAGRSRTTKPVHRCRQTSRSSGRRQRRHARVRALAAGRAVRGCQPPTTENWRWKKSAAGLRHLVLTDVMMPEMDGFALLAALASESCHGHSFPSSCSRRVPAKKPASKAWKREQTTTSPSPSPPAN